MHHSLIDGAGSDAFMSALHDLEPDPKPAADADEGQLAQFDEAEPGNTQLIGRSLAVREGFEPSVRCRTHTFQACSFDRSDTSP